MNGHFYFTCDQCGGIGSRTSTYYLNRFSHQFCSVECWKEFRRSKEVCTCVVCGKTMERIKYYRERGSYIVCSAKCQAKVQSSTRNPEGLDRLAIKRKSSKKGRENLNDSYVKMRLRNAGMGNVSPELIDEYRKLILIHRKILKAKEVLDGNRS